MNPNASSELLNFYLVLQTGINFLPFTLEQLLFKQVDLRQLSLVLDSTVLEEKSLDAGEAIKVTLDGRRRVEP